MTRGQHRPITTNKSNDRLEIDTSAGFVDGFDTWDRTRRIRASLSTRCGATRGARAGIGEVPVRGTCHAPRGGKATVGFLRSREKNRLVVEYALRHLQRPIGGAQWKPRLVEKLPKELKGSLPSVEQIEGELAPKRGDR